MLQSKQTQIRAIANQKSYVMNAHTGVTKQNKFTQMTQVSLESTEATNYIK